MLNPHDSMLRQYGLMSKNRRSLPSLESISSISLRYFTSVLGKTNAWTSPLGPDAASAVIIALPYILYTKIDQDEESYEKKT